MNKDHACTHLGVCDQGIHKGLWLGHEGANALNVPAIHTAFVVKARGQRVGLLG